MQSSMIPAVCALIAVGSALVFLAPTDAADATSLDAPQSSIVEPVRKTPVRSAPPTATKAVGQEAGQPELKESSASAPAVEDTVVSAPAKPAVASDSSLRASRFSAAREAALRAAERRLSAGASEPRIENGQVIIDNHPVRVATGDGRVMVIPARVVATPNKKVMTTPAALRAAPRVKRK